MKRLLKTTSLVLIIMVFAIPLIATARINNLTGTQSFKNGGFGTKSGFTKSNDTAVEAILGETFASNDLLTLTNTRFVLDSAYTQQIWQEDSTAVALNHPTSSGSLVGQYDDVGTKDSHILECLANVRRPAWFSASGTQNTYIQFKTGGGDDICSIENSTTAFNFLHRGVSSTIAFTAMSNETPGGSKYWFDSLSGTGANNGISWLYRTDKKFQILIAAGGTTILNYTTVATAEPNVWNDVILRLGNVGGAIQIGDATPETFNYGTLPPAGAASANATFPFRIGAQADNTDAGNFNLQKFVITESYMTAEEITTFRAWNPLANTTELLTQSVSVADGRYTGLRRWMNFGSTANANTSTLWTDTTRNTAVATLNDPVRKIDHFLSWGNGSYHLNRSLTVTGTANFGIWQTATSGVDWIPNQTSFDFSSTWTVGGAKEIFACIETDNVDFSTHFLTGGQYWACTGPGYVDNPGGVPYCTLHQQSGNAGFGPLANTGAMASNIIQISRNGDAWTLWTNGTMGSSTTNIAGWDPVRMGQDQLASSALWLNGRVNQLREYIFPMTATQRQNIVNDLATECGISL